MPSALLGQTQEDIPPQIVELKDGGRLLGSILEDNEYAVTIVILTGDTLEIGYKYISAVGPLDDSRVRRVVGNRRSVARGGDTAKSELYDKEFVSNDIIKIISVGITSGEGGAGAGLLGSLDLIKMLNAKLGIGGGLAFNRHQRFIINDVTFNRIDLRFLPVYVSSRYVIAESMTFKPFAQLDVGYGFGIATDRFGFDSEYNFNGGPYGQLHVGTTIANRRKYNMQLSLNLLYQRTSGNITGFDFNFGNPFESDFNLSIIRPGFTVGIVF